MTEPRFRDIELVSEHSKIETILEEVWIYWKQELMTFETSEPLYPSLRGSDDICRLEIRFGLKARIWVDRVLQLLLLMR